MCALDPGPLQADMARAAAPPVIGHRRTPLDLASVAYDFTVAMAEDDAAQQVREI